MTYRLFVTVCRRRPPPPMTKTMPQSASACRPRPISLPATGLYLDRMAPRLAPGDGSQPPHAREPPFCLVGRPADAPPKSRSHMSDCLRAVPHRADNNFEKNHLTELLAPRPRLERGTYCLGGTPETSLHSAEYRLTCHFAAPTAASALAMNVYRVLPPSLFEHPAAELSVDDSAQLCEDRRQPDHIA